MAISSTSSHQPTPRFGGVAATQQAMQGKPGTGGHDVFLNRKELTRALADDHDPYLGFLPQAFSGTDLNRQKLFHGLDDLAEQLGKTYNQKRFDQHVGQPFDYQLGKRTVSITPIAYGMFGQVFKIDAGGESFAFKVFYKNREPLRNGPFWESAIGLFLNGKGARDMVRYIAGNPAKSWYMTEFIDDTKNISQRTGPTVRDLGFRFVDEKPDNLINGIRVDYGSLWHPAGAVGRTKYHGTKIIRDVARPMYHRVTGR